MEALWDMVVVVSARERLGEKCGGVKVFIGG